MELGPDAVEFAAIATALIPVALEDRWPKYVELIKRCWDDKVEKRPTAHEVVLALQNIISNKTGDEDAHLGLDTFPLRKFIFERAMRFYHARKKIDWENGIFFNYIFLKNFFFEIKFTYSP